MVWKANHQGTPLCHFFWSPNKYKTHPGQHHRQSKTPSISYSKVKKPFRNSDQWLTYGPRRKTNKRQNTPPDLTRLGPPVESLESGNQLFSVVYFRGTLPAKKETVRKGHLAGGPRRSCLVVSGFLGLGLAPSFQTVMKPRESFSSAPASVSSRRNLVETTSVARET